MHCRKALWSSTHCRKTLLRRHYVEVSIAGRFYGVVSIVVESSGLSQTGFGLHSRDRG